MMITSAVCWGSWANTYKGVEGYRFELFYWDYAVGIFLVSLVIALTMGSTGHDASSFLNNVHAADSSNIINALIGGALFNLANLLLVAAIDMAGLAVAFPISIGIALVVGTVADVCGLGHRRRALFDQAVGSFGARIDRRSRNSKNLAALVERKARGDQRTGALGGLDDDDAERSPEISRLRRGKSLRARLPAERHFGERAPAGRMASSRLACSAG